MGFVGQLRGVVLLAILLPPFAFCSEIDWTCRYGWSELDPSPYKPEFGERSVRYSTKLADAFEIATGSMGVKILRIVPKDGSAPFILKQYQSLKTNAKFEDDWRAADIMNGLRDSAADANTFYIVKTEDLRPQRLAMRIEDVPGRSLQEVLKDSHVPESVKSALVAEYLQKSNALLTLLKKKYGERNIKVKSSRWFRGTELTEVLVTQPDGSTTMLNIGPDQVVSFEKTNSDVHRMSLVDSY